MMLDSHPHICCGPGVAVADDGIGGAEPQNGTGLVGLTDRIEALGGRLHIDSPRGRGTRLSAEIPCD
jgi:signal transduction histidine kinase